MSGSDPRISLFAVFTSVRFGFGICQHEYVVELLLDARDTSRVLALYDVFDLLGQVETFFLNDIAVLYNADVIVFEHLDRNGKVRGSKKQKLKLWRSQEVQSIVTNKAHRLGIRISRICAWHTSRLAYDGSGRVVRGKEGGFSTYELCKFQNGKIYNCDLSASYNIGARYFIREILKSLDESSRLAIEAKVPQSVKRSTCTFSTLVNLNAEIIAQTA